MNIHMINNLESAKNAYFQALHKYPVSESVISLRAFFNAFESDSPHKLAALRFVDAVERSEGENGFIYGMLSDATDKFLNEFFA